MPYKNREDKRKYQQKWLRTPKGKAAKKRWNQKYYDSHLDEIKKRKHHEYKIKKQSLSFLKRKKLSSLESRYRLKYEILNYYSKGQMKCTYCPERRFEALEIDHINNDGYLERKEDKRRAGFRLYQILRKNKFPKGYQVLCSSCNRIKQIFPDWKGENIEEFRRIKTGISEIPPRKRKPGPK